MKASGIEDIRHKTEVLIRIATHYNNPDASDVTLIVAEQSYYVHRFILVAQSSVFQSMLTGDKWKESNEKVIQLEESPASAIAFGDFLKFFYTGMLTLNCDNVCGIHMLADKYDVQLLKKDAENFMKDVMTGVHGDALSSSMKWLGHIEQFIPDLLPSCYEAIQINFYDLALAKASNPYFDLLESRHIKEILTSTSSANEVVVSEEKDVFDFVTKWAKSKFNNLSSEEATSELNTIFPLIRFHNMELEELEEVEESELCKAMGNSFLGSHISRAYKVHCQMTRLVRSASKKRRLSEDIDGAPVDNCPCESGAACPHLNPRFYFHSAGGVCVNTVVDYVFRLHVKPVDLGDLETYAKLFTGIEENYMESNTEWAIEWLYDYDSNPGTIKETFTVQPTASDIGRQFTIVISLDLQADDVSSEKKYTIKHTGIVRQSNEAVGAEPILLDSPRRHGGSWTMQNDENLWLGITVHLHKQ